jgi:DNA-binding NarL/FixJ family response regulator
MIGNAGNDHKNPQEAVWMSGMIEEERVGMTTLDAVQGQILLIEDRHLVSAGLRASMRTSPGLLSRIALVVVESTQEAAAAVDARTQLILIDIGATGSDCKPLAGFMELRAQVPQIPIAILSASECPRLLSEALQAGAAGFISQRAPLTIVLAAIELMLAGGIYLPPQLVNLLRERDDEEAETGISLVEGCALTSRQQSVLDLVFQGQSNKEIARRLSLSVGTVKNYVSDLLRLTHAATRGRLVASRLNAAGTRFNETVAGHRGEASYETASQTETGSA